MRVYKALMKLYRRSYAIIIPIVIYLVISVVLSYVNSGEQPKNLNGKNYRVAIVNEDGSKLSKAVEEYIKSEYKIDKEITTIKSIKNALFFARIDNGIVIPKDFSNDYKIEEYNYTSFASSFLIGKSINSYINIYLSFRKTMDEDEAISKTNETLNKNVETISNISNKKANILNSFRWFIVMFSYVSIISLFNSLNAVNDFNDSQIKSRILSSNITSKDFQKQVLASMVTVGFVLYLILVVLSILLYGTEISFSKNGIMMLSRLLLHLMTITSMTYLLNSIALNQRILSMIANFLAISFAFLGGVFIPVRYVAKNMLMFSKLTPTYWFSTGIDSILATGAFSEQVMKGIYIEVLMIIAFSTLAFAIRYQKRKNSISW